MDYLAAKKVFNEYTDNYDKNDINVRLKIAHTYRVAELAGRIASSVKADEDFAWLLGLLHDIGRFEQLKRYGTFVDHKSIDHAELGADILFNDRLIERFCSADPGGLPDGWYGIAEKAIRLHNKLIVPDDLDEESALYARILRDADKIDIFRVLTEPPYDVRNADIEAESALHPVPARDSVIQCVKEHRCVPRVGERTDFEAVISACCMAFELEFPISRNLAADQGYLYRMMALKAHDVRMQEQIDLLKAEIHSVMMQTVG